MSDQQKKQQTFPPGNNTHTNQTYTNPISQQLLQKFLQKRQNHSHSARSQSQSSNSYSSRSNSLESNKQSIRSNSKRQQKQQKPNQTQNKKDINRDQPQRKIRYKYCCKVCKHTDKSKKACVCVVPKSQRRTQIGPQGCQTCACVGCSKEDFISRGEDPEYKPGQKKKVRKDREKQGTEFEARNGCCRKCMKAFSKSNKSCLCQVPEDVRNTKLPSSGCKICGCFGCNPEDKKDPRHRKTSKKQRQRSRSRQKRKKYVRSQSSSSNSKQHIQQATLNFYNIDKSVLGIMMVNQYRIDPSLLGFGIPQRTYNYIIGKPK